MKNRVLFCISAALLSISLVSCGEKNPDQPKSDHYYHSYGGQISKISTVYVDEEPFGSSNVRIVVPTPDNHITFEYPLYIYNNKTFDLTKADENFSKKDWNGWGYYVAGEEQDYYWAAGPFAQSGSVLCRASRGVNFSAIVNGKFKVDGMEIEINLNLPGAESFPPYSGTVVTEKPEMNYVAVTVDEVYQDKLSVSYIADASEEIATVFVKLADDSYMVFEYDIEDYNGKVYDLSKSDSKADENPVSYTIAYNKKVDYKKQYDKYLFTGEDVETMCFSGTCKPNLSFDANGAAHFSIELHAKTSFGRGIDLVYDGPAELADTRPLPEPSSHKIHRLANGQ